MRNIRRRVITILIILVFLVQFSNGLIHVSASSPDGFGFISCNWGSVDNPQKAYPGSTNIILVLELINKYPYTLNSVVGNLSLPTGFTDINGYNYSMAVGTVQTNSISRSSVEPGEVFRLSYILNLNENLTPGIYKISVALNYTYLSSSSGALTSSTYTLSDIPIKVSDFPVYSFTVKKIAWYAGNTITNATVGSRGLSLHIMMENKANVSIDDLYTYLNLSKSFNPTQVSIHYGRVDAKTSFELVFNDINIEYNASPGAYIEDLALNYTFRGYGNALNNYNTQLNITLYIHPSVNANLELVKVSWQGFDKGYSGERGGYINLVLENMGDYTLTNIYCVGYLPNGFKSQFNISMVNSTYSGNVGYGHFLKLSLGPLYIEQAVPPNVYYMPLHIRGTGIINGVDVIVEENLSVPIIVNKYSPLFEVVSVEWSHDGQPALALAGSKDIILVIKLAYRGEEELSGINPSINLPDGFKVKSLSQLPQIITPSTVFTISFELDISCSVEAKDYISTLKIRYTVAPNGQNTIKSASLSIPYHITSADKFDTEIDVLNGYWGWNNPIHVYPGTQNNPLTITLVDKGVYDAYQLYIKYSLPKGFYISPNVSNIIGLMHKSSFAQLFSYVNVSDSVSPGYYKFNVTLYYELHIYGDVLNKSKETSFDILISEPIYPPPHLKIIRYMWKGDQDMYSGTDHAILQISIENDAMFSISAIHLYAKTIKGISLSEAGNYLYLSGPISQWQAFTVSLDLNISNTVKAGLYPLNLTFDYILNSGGDGHRVVENQTILIRISKLEGIEYITYKWLGGSSGPGSAGSTLLLVFRNNKFSSIRGLYATISLPKGFISTENGRRIFNITPSDSVEVSKGGFITIPISLIINSNISTGYYYANVSLNFLDNWLIARSVTLQCGFSLPGSTNYIEVLENVSKIYVGEREANISILLKNPGTATMYDVYASINSVSQMITFSSAVRHLDKIKAGEEIKLVWRASVSPTASFSGGVPVVINVIFTDPSGTKHILNQTAILFVEAYPKLKLIDITISPEVPCSNSTLSISATIVNVGNDVAKNTEVYLEGKHLITNSDSYTFLGDIDVGSQIPFTLYGALDNYTGKTTINLVIKYSNVYNEVETLKFPINIFISRMPEAKGGGSITTFFLRNNWIFIVVASVIIFLAVVSILIYKMYLASKRRLGMS